MEYNLKNTNLTQAEAIDLLSTINFTQQAYEASLKQGTCINIQTILIEMRKNKEQLLIITAQFPELFV